jgi:hypothetical protein
VLGVTELISAKALNEHKAKASMIVKKIFFLSICLLHLEFGVNENTYKNYFPSIPHPININFLRENIVNYAKIVQKFFNSLIFYISI